MGIGQMDASEQLAANRFEAETRALGLMQIPHFDMGQDNGCVCSHQMDAGVLSTAHFQALRGLLDSSSYGKLTDTSTLYLWTQMGQVILCWHYDMLRD